MATPFHPGDKGCCSLEGDSRLLSLPQGLLADIVRRALCLHGDTANGIAGSCTALLHALLGCEGASLRLDVASANPIRCGNGYCSKYLMGTPTNSDRELVGGAAALHEHNICCTFP